MSLTEEDVAMIVKAMKPVIVEPLRDVATAHQLAVQLIQETVQKLEECKLRLEAITLDVSRATHHEVDAETSIGLWRDMAGIYKRRTLELEAALTQKQVEIKELTKQLSEKHG